MRPQTRPRWTRTLDADSRCGQDPTSNQPRFSPGPAPAQPDSCSAGSHRTPSKGQVPGHSDAPHAATPARRAPLPGLPEPRAPTAVRRERLRCPGRRAAPVVETEGCSFAALYPCWEASQPLPKADADSPGQGMKTSAPSAGGCPSTALPFLAPWPCWHPRSPAEAWDAEAVKDPGLTLGL